MSGASVAQASWAEARVATVRSSAVSERIRAVVLIALSCQRLALPDADAAPGRVLREGPGAHEGLVAELERDRDGVLVEELQVDGDAFQLDVVLARRRVAQVDRERAERSGAGAEARRRPG